MKLCIASYLSLLLLLVTVTASAQLATNMVGEYLFNGGFADTGPLNITAVGHNVTPTMGHDGVPNGAYHFNGTTSYIDLSNHVRGINGADVASFSMYVKTTDTTFGLLLSRYTSDQESGIQVGYHEMGTAASLTLRLTGGPVVNNRAFTPIHDNQWHCLVFTMGPAQSSVYVDGILQGSTTAGWLDFYGTVLIRQERLFLGARNLNPGNFTIEAFEGDIDDFRIWNRVLTPAEVGQVCACPSDGIVGGLDTTACASDSPIVLESLRPFNDHLWSPGGDTTSSISVSYPDSGWYYLDITGIPGGCTVRDSVFVNWKARPSSFDIGSDYIVECSLLSVPLSANIAADDYLWTNGSTSQTTSIVYPDSGWQKVTITYDGCRYSDSVYISWIDELPSIHIGEDFSLCDGDSRSVTAVPPSASINWNTGATGAAIQVNAPGIYWAAITNECGTSYDSLYVSRRYNCDTDPVDTSETERPKTFYIPTAFSPNGDGLNDEFSVVHNGEIAAFRFTVFDRWGNTVFESFDESIGWNGSQMNTGERCQQGTYSWIIRYRDKDSSSYRQLSGTLLLIR